jgi:vancomycin resistance protein YoaR
LKIENYNHFFKNKMNSLIKKTSIIIFVIAIISPLVFFAFLENIYAQKIYPNIKIAKIDIGGLAIPSAENLLEIKIQNAFEEKIVFAFEDKKWETNFQEIGFFISAEENALLAYQIGHRKNIFLNFKEQIKSIFKGYNFKISYFLDDKKLDEFLSEKIKIENSPTDASLVFFIDENGKKDFKLKPAENGLIIDKNDLKKNLDFKIRDLSPEPISLKFIKGYPEVKNNEIEKARNQALEIINRPLKLKYENQIFEIEAEKIASWLSFVPIKESKKTANKILGVQANQEKIKEYLESLAPQINQEPINAELTIENEKVAVFALNQDGIKLSVEKNLEKISQALFAKTGSWQTDVEIILETEKSKAEITTESIENLGITSLIGQGTSNFAGSPKNRQHNIKIGSATFHGVLIKPEEEFSFNKIIGKVGASKGYLPELVIKNNRTVAEYGGGLCQISTTCFRAALYSGLKITERRPHAYAVQYYNPQGTDATIYPPHPDLRFINDTPNYILIQTKIEGNILTFDFYGTDDGREVKIDGPYIYDKKKSGAMKAVVHQEIYRDGKLDRKESFYSSYNSPALYPH